MGGKRSEGKGKAGTYLFSPAPVLDKHVCFCLIANSVPVLISASRVNKCRSGMGGDRGLYPARLLVLTCQPFLPLSPPLARPGRHADGTAAS